MHCWGLRKYKPTFKQCFPVARFLSYSFHTHIHMLPIPRFSSSPFVFLWSQKKKPPPPKTCNVVKFKFAKPKGRWCGEGPLLCKVGLGLWKGGEWEAERSEVWGTEWKKHSANKTEEASSGLAKSLLSFPLFFPNNSCPLIPCYSAVKNKTSLWLSVFLFFPRVGLITGD